MLLTKVGYLVIEFSFISMGGYFENYLMPYSLKLAKLFILHNQIEIVKVGAEMILSSRHKCKFNLSYIIESINKELIFQQ